MDIYPWIRGCVSTTLFWIFYGYILDTKWIYIHTYPDIIHGYSKKYPMDIWIRRCVSMDNIWIWVDTVWIQNGYYVDHIHGYFESPRYPLCVQISIKYLDMYPDIIHFVSRKYPNAWIISTYPWIFYGSYPVANGTITSNQFKQYCLMSINYFLRNGARNSQNRTFGRKQ